MITILADDGVAFPHRECIKLMSEEAGVVDIVIRGRADHPLEDKAVEACLSFPLALAQMLQTQKSDIHPNTY